jgi:hypothetical protein
VNCFVVDLEIEASQKIFTSGCATDVSKDILHSAWNNAGLGVITCLNEHSVASHCFVRKNDNDRTYEREGFSTRCLTIRKDDGVEAIHGSRDMTSSDSIVDQSVV